MQTIWHMAETMSARAIAAEVGKPEIFVSRSLSDKRLLFYQALQPDLQTGEMINCDWPAVMTAEQAKLIKAARRIRRTSKQGTKRQFSALLSNLQLVFCGYCGRTVKTWTNTRKRADGTCVNYYGCQTKDTRLKCERARLVAQNVLDFAITTNVFNTLSDLAGLAHYWDAHQERMNTGEELQRTGEEIKKLQEKKKRLISAITNGVMELSDAKEAMDEIKNRIETLEQQRHDIAANIMAPPDWDSIDLTRDEFSQLDMIHQREFLQLVIDKVDLFNMHALITYKFPRKPDGTHTAKINLPAVHRGKRLDK